MAEDHLVFRDILVGVFVAFPAPGVVAHFVAFADHAVEVLVGEDDRKTAGWGPRPDHQCSLSSSASMSALARITPMSAMMIRPTRRYLRLSMWSSGQSSQ